MKIGRNQKGMAHVAIILVVVVLAVVGGVGYMVYSRSKDKDKDSVTVSSKQLAAASKETEQACKKIYSDDDLCKFSSHWTGTTQAYKATFTTKDKDGKTTVMLMESDGKGNSSSTSQENGKETGAFVSYNKATYIKNADDGVWIKYAATESTAKNEDPTSDLKFDTTDDGKTEPDTTTYKKIGKEACGKLTCFKYQVIDPSTPGSENYIWFDDKDYVLRKWSNKDADGSTSEATFDFTAVSIKEPTPVKDAPKAPTQAEIQAQIDAAMQAEQ